MNAIQKKQIRKMLVPLFVLICHQTASAYYDPGVQRWINRDPEGESQSLNLYEFVSDSPVSHVDALGLKKAAAAPPPKADTCNPQQRQQINAAMAQANSRMRQSCSDPACMSLIADGAQGARKKPKVDCARQGDPECAKGFCAYSQGKTITLCPGSAFPATGQNCPGNGGPMTLDCILIHELQHVGAKGKRPDDANKLQQCLGCPYGQPHPRK